MIYIHFKCSACGKHLEVDVVGRGQKVYCPDCSVLIEVPYARDEHACPHCKYSVLVSYNLYGTEINCSSCGKPYLIQATPKFIPNPIIYLEKRSLECETGQHPITMDQTRVRLKILAWSFIGISFVLCLVMGNSESDNWVLLPAFFFVLGLSIALINLILRIGASSQEEVDINETERNSFRSRLNDGIVEAKDWLLGCLKGGAVVTALMIAFAIYDGYEQRSGQQKAEPTASSGEKPAVRQEQQSANLNAAEIERKRKQAEAESAEKKEVKRKEAEAGLRSPDSKKIDWAEVENIVKQAKEQRAQQAEAERRRYIQSLPPYVQDAENRVRAMIDNGQLEAAQYVNTYIENVQSEPTPAGGYPDNVYVVSRGGGMAHATSQNMPSVDKKAYVVYDFTYVSVGGFVNRRRGWLVYTRDSRTGRWSYSDWLSQIDHMPKNNPSW